jgi:xanthine/CO dehydrogenase XdhC/CoxF family maturation factor
VNHALSDICRFFRAAERMREPLVLASVLRTDGSTYSKAGARVLIAADGRTSGMISGGCLESDLRERALRVLARKLPERAWFDTRESDDPVWGLGMGCEGAMDIWLQAELPEEQYPLLRYLQRCLESEHAAMIATVVGGQANPAELGIHAFRGHPGGTALERGLAALLEAAPARCAELRELKVGERALEVLIGSVDLAPSLLICGAGADAVPVQLFAANLGWRVTVYDHRPAYASDSHFPLAARVLCSRPEELPERLDLPRFDAAIVMSHNLAADIAYLRALADRPPTYIGLLGPPARRQRLFAEVGDAVRRVAGRIHGPVGLDIGAGSPEGIALAIVAQIHAVLAGKPGGPFELPMSG